MKNKISIEWVEETDSTSSEVQRRKDFMENWSAIAAISQTAGRGQRGNKWLAPKGENLTFSLLLKFIPGEVRVSDQILINEATALAVHDYLVSEGIPCSIKWPNDIYCRNRKICGMLVENSLSGGYISSSVIGIGVNVNQKEFHSTLMNPTSMTLLSGKQYSLEKELEKLCAFLYERLQLPFDSRIKEEYEQSLYRKGVFHEYTDCISQTSLTCRIVGVTDEGKLRVETKKGEIKDFAFKEISYII